MAAAPDGRRLAARRDPPWPTRCGGLRCPRVPPMPVVEAIRAAPGDRADRCTVGGALVEETALIARWLAAPGVRVVCCHGADDGGWPRRCGRRTVGGVGGRRSARRRPNRP
ncbi:DNA polymerase III epsilon subunit domain protein [Mycobacterium xenopi 3993]|nr:DNA polymerase III epsilon subunit domain protein [Mycobacterium xenopi 3993]